MDYNIDNVGDWLEDSLSGRYSRYSVEDEIESVWICNECGNEFNECLCEDAEDQLNDCREIRDM